MAASANGSEGQVRGPTIADGWARDLGLAPVPLFDDVVVGDGSHEILLDGGLGSFAISVTSEELWRDRRAAEWAWSSGVPHHVTVTPDKVAVTRWDAKAAELFTVASVRDRLDAFYRYLVTDRIRSNTRVVDELVELFRKTRSAVAQTQAPDERSVDVFLALLAEGMERAGRKRLPAVERDALKLLPGAIADGLASEIAGQASRGDLLGVHPDLSIRHAGSEIFQEAHFALSQAPAPDLLGWIGPATSKRETRGTAHFTPPALARSIVERALGELGDVAGRATLTIMDPACGSGSFLYEAVRALRRMNYSGRLRVVGRDISEAAVSMARFVLSLAESDWSPQGGMEVDLRAADSLREDMPACDVLLMNPPFLSWNAMSAEQRDLTRGLMRGLLQGRTDLSMVFVARAFSAISPGGVLGALVPASLLTLLSAEKWRHWLTERADVRMLAFLGDYGLFRHATVQVAGLVLRNGVAAGGGEALAMIAGDTAQSTGDAFRAVRRGGNADGRGGSEGRWHVFPVPSSSFAKAPNWRLVPPAAAAALERLDRIGATRPVGELFDVRQGIRTGDNRRFVLSAADHAKLPPGERRWFRPAMTGDNLVEGRLAAGEWLFYPYEAAGPLLDDEDELRRKLPEYYARVLLPHREDLSSRSSLSRSGRQDWWGLSERRAWSITTTPRIVSKYFGAPGSFALDLEGRYAVVQGYAWFPRAGPVDVAAQQDDEEDLIAPAAAMVSAELLPAFAALFNSRPFHAVLRLFSSYVGGGQYDLSPRFVNQVPVPDLAAASRDERAGAWLAKLAGLAARMATGDPEWQDAATATVRSLYGEALFEDL